MDYKKQLTNVFESGRVLRYHAQPEMSRFGQTTADHSWGCAALLFVLFDDPEPELVKGAVFHDSGERWAGDLPYPAKLKDPAMAAEHAKVEHRLAEENGIPGFELDETQTKKLKLVDRLESHLYGRLTNPVILQNDGFKNQARHILELSRELGCYSKVEALMRNDYSKFDTAA